MVPTITKETLSALLIEPHVRLVDVRPIAVFRGWRRASDARGGHIPGAIPMPVTWVESGDDPGLEELLVEMHITPGHHIVLYGDESAEPRGVGERLGALGYRNLATYGRGFGEWAADERLEVERLARYEQLVPAEWLADLLAGRSVEAAPPADFAVYHATFAGSDEYRAGHLPGAFELDTNELESPVDHNRRSPEELECYLLDRGITSDTTVILYGRDGAVDSDGSRRTAGQIAATRAAAILLYAGVRDVRMLDGGYGAWIAAGHDVETFAHIPEAVPAFGREIPARSELFIDLDEAKELLADPDGVLVSIRSWAEHVGDTSGYDYIGQRGDIPGAVWAGGSADAHDMSQYRSPDNTMLAPAVIAARWQELGITPGRRVAFYCGTGWRASEAFFDAYLMGWPRIAIYDGGWFEWAHQTRVQGVR